MPSYLATYTVSGNEISLSTDGTQILSSFIGVQAYLYVSLSNGSQCVIDLSRYMLIEKNIDYSLALDIIAIGLTDFQIAGCETNIIPFVDGNTGGYDNRLNVYDAFITSDVTVDYTSIASPSVKSVVYNRDELNDLVISSNTRDFANCLVSVNGVFHPTIFYDKQLFVEKGFSNIKNCKQSKVCIYDTTELGGHLIVPINAENIDASNTQPFSGVTLTFQNTDFTGTTVLLVIGGYLYALDDVYHLINKNRLKIDICKIDLIDNVIHDPNTSYVFNNTEIVVPDPNSPGVPNVVDEITYYIQSLYPPAIANVISPVNFINFTLYTGPADTSAPPTATLINGFLLNYPYTIPPAGDKYMITKYYTHTVPTNIVNSISYSIFQNPNFVYSLLMQSNSFLIVIKNSTVYKRTYDLYQSQIPAQYVTYSEDTPRGILQYDHNRSLPYLLYAESNNSNYNFSIDYAKIYADVYKTVINPQTIPSPVLDVRCDLNLPVRLLELYSPAL